MDSVLDMMEFLVENRAEGLDARVLADLFDRMIWILRDNGREVLEVRSAWLDGGDPLRVEIALLMNEVFPFDNGLDMEKRLLEIERRWPRFEGLCKEIRQRWGGQFGAK